MDVIIVDPTDNPQLAELADLSGVTWQRVPAWPFQFPTSSRILSTIPVPAPARQEVLGVVVPGKWDPGLAEAWPARRVPVTAHAEILAFLAGAHAPARPRVGVFGARGGLGVSTLALAVTLRLAELPLTVSHVDQDPYSLAPEWIGVPDPWPSLTADGPLLPSRVVELLPRWSRARVAAGRCESVQTARNVAAALSRVQDVTVEDRGRLAGEPTWAHLTAAVFVMRADDDDLRLWDTAPSDMPVIPVVRPGVLTLADAADVLGRPVIALETERRPADGVPAALVPRRRARGAVARAAREVVTELQAVLW